MRKILAFFTFFMLNFSYVQIPQNLYLSLILGYSFFVVLFLLNDKGYLKFCMNNKVTFLLFVIVLISYFFTNNENVSLKTKILDILNWTFCFIYFTNFIKYSIEKGINPLKPIIFSVLAFAFINVLLYLVFGNLRTTTPNIENVFFKIFTGITIYKANFLFGSLSINHNAILIAIISPFILLIKSRLIRRIGFGLLGLSLILLDNRMSIIAIILSILLFYPLKRMKLSTVTKLIAFIIPLMVMLLLVILPLIPMISGIEYFSRNPEELLTANSRTLIWASALETISQFNLSVIFGIGDYGNLAYKESTDYLSIFLNYENSEIKTSHNTYLQLVLDKGYVFLILFYIFIIRYLNKLFRFKNDKIAQTFILSLLIFLICGTTEVLIGGYFMPITFLFLMMPLFINNYNFQRIEQYEI